MSDRLRGYLDTLLWLGAGVVALVIAPFVLLANAVMVRVDRAARGAR